MHDFLLIYWPFNGWKEWLSRMIRPLWFDLFSFNFFSSHWISCEFTLHWFILEFLWNFRSSQHANYAISCYEFQGICNSICFNFSFTHLMEKKLQYQKKKFEVWKPVLSWFVDHIDTTFIIIYILLSTSNTLITLLQTYLTWYQPFFYYKRKFFLENEKFGSIWTKQTFLVAKKFIHFDH